MELYISRTLPLGLYPWIERVIYTWLVNTGTLPASTALKYLKVVAQLALKEETGLQAKNWEKLFEMDLSNSVTDERAIVYLATDLEQGEPDPEETEVLSVSKIHLTEAYQMVLDGKITDSITVAALFKMKIKLLENEK